MDTRKPYFFKWEIVLLFVSLLISIASLCFSVYSTKQSEKLISAPNIQLVSAKADRSHTTIDSLHTNFKIVGNIIIENVGKAPTQIIDIKWEPIESGDKMPIQDPLLAISDYINPNAQAYKNLFYQYRNNPVLGLKNKTISPGESKTIQMAFYAKDILSLNHNIPTIRLIFVFDNGEQRTIIPEIEVSSAGD